MVFVSCIVCGEDSRVISRKTVDKHTLATTLRCKSGHIWDTYDSLSPLDGIYDTKPHEAKPDEGGEDISDELDGGFTD